MTLGPLDPRDEAIARRVVEVLREAEMVPQVRPRWMTAQEVADMLGCAVSVIYRRAEELGAVRIGDGPRPRLRFDPECVGEALRRRGASERSDAAAPAADRTTRRRTIGDDGASAPPLPARPGKRAS